MIYEDQDPLTNEDLVAAYPRRLERSRDYELWQFPYVKENTLYGEDDLVAIKFGDRVNHLTLFTTNPNRIKDRAYLDRVLVLVHDLDKDFKLDTYHISPEDGEGLKVLLEKFKDNQ